MQRVANHLVVVLGYLAVEAGLGVALDERPDLGRRHPPRVKQLVRVERDRVAARSQPHEHVQVALIEAEAMTVAQADHALERAFHARLLHHLAQHGVRKVLAWIGKAAGQLPSALVPCHRRDALLYHEHLVARVEHHAADADLGEAVGRQRARRRKEPARHQQVSWLCVVKCKPVGRGGARKASAREWDAQPEATLSSRRPAVDANPQRVCESLSGDGGSAVKDLDLNATIAVLLGRIETSRGDARTA